MFKGSLVALVTPMLDNGDIDYEALQKLIDFHVDQGSHGLVIAGTTGESATLDFDEHCTLLDRAREMIAGRIPMIAGTGANSTREAIHLTRCAERAGPAPQGHRRGGGYPADPLQCARSHRLRHAAGNGAAPVEGGSHHRHQGSHGRPRKAAPDSAACRR